MRTGKPTKLSKTDMPQRRHGDPPEERAPQPWVCFCDLDGRVPAHLRGSMRYTGEVRHLNASVIVGVFQCIHGRRWLRHRPIPDRPRIQVPA